MVPIIFVQPDGNRKSVFAVEGNSVMMAARANNIDGILAECGGNMACGTCHVYVAKAYLDLIPPPEVLEDQILDATASERLPNSRLSCQIIVTHALENLEVTCPESQN